MADSKTFNDAAQGLAGICRQAAGQNPPAFTAGMAFAQANLTQETLRALIKHLQGKGLISVTELDVLTESCFNERTAQMTQGPALILPDSVTAPVKSN